MDGPNWYVYCSNNPILYIDPSGLTAEDAEKYINDPNNPRPPAYGEPGYDKDKSLAWYRGWSKAYEKAPTPEIIGQRIAKEAVKDYEAWKPDTSDYKQLYSRGPAEPWCGHFAGTMLIKATGITPPDYYPGVKNWQIDDEHFTYKAGKGLAGMEAGNYIIWSDGTKNSDGSLVAKHMSIYTGNGMTLGGNEGNGDIKHRKIDNVKTNNWYPIGYVVVNP